MSIVDIEEFPYYIPYMDKVNSYPDMGDVRASIRDSDGILIVTPQENNGLPHVLKNALHWFSQRVERSCLLRKPVFICSFSRDDDGGVGAQLKLSHMLLSLSHRIGPQYYLALPHIDDVFEEGLITNAVTIATIRDALARFVQEICEYQRFASSPWRDGYRLKATG
jgi:chromate reductase